jgi:hypothetical protein
MISHPNPSTWSLPSSGKISVPLADTYSEQIRYLDSVIDDGGREQSLTALRTYFNAHADLNLSFTVRNFERFAGGGVAIATTSTHAERISELLRHIPTDLAMHDADWEIYASGSAAAQLWELFCHSGGEHRWVTANKLLARKRPHLLPVYDTQVMELLGAPTSFWECLWDVVLRGRRSRRRAGRTPQ